MVIVLWLLVVILSITVILLSVKIYLLRKSAKQINKGFKEKLEAKTNTIIGISSRDKCMVNLANGVNEELISLHQKRNRYEQGDIEVKNAITNISHDLRTPLTAILGYLDLIDREEKNENVKRYIDIIKNRADTLKQLTEELFKYSVSVSTINDKIYENVVLNSLLEDSISFYYVALKEKNITPKIDITDTKIERYLDKKSVSRIFSNIISNAIKYSNGDLSITLSKDGEITFSNTAKDLDNIQVERLFDRFYTVENASKSTGLGLSISKLLTEEMGGEITSKYKNDILSISINFKNKSKKDTN